MAALAQMEHEIKRERVIDRSISAAMPELISGADRSV